MSENNDIVTAALSPAFGPDFGEGGIYSSGLARDPGERRWDARSAYAEHGLDDCMDTASALESPWDLGCVIAWSGSTVVVCDSIFFPYRGANTFVQRLARCSEPSGSSAVIFAMMANSWASWLTRRPAGSLTPPQDGTVALDPFLYSVSPLQLWLDKLVAVVSQTGTLEDEWLPVFTNASGHLRYIFAKVRSNRRAKAAFFLQWEIDGMFFSRGYS